MVAEGQTYFLGGLNKSVEIKLKKRIRTELDNKIVSKKEELVASCGTMKNELDGKCAAGLSDIQKEKEKIDGKVKQLEAGIKQIADKENKEAQEKAKEEIKKKIPSGLKKLF